MADPHWAPSDSEDYRTLRQAAVEGDTQRLATIVKDKNIDLHALYGDGFEGRTLLHDAAAQGREDTIRFLLDHGVAVDVLDMDQFGCTTPLFYAARNVRIDAIRILLDAGADITVKGPNDNTVGSAVLPDAVTVTQDHIVSMELLLDRGFDVNTRASEYGPTVVSHDPGEWEAYAAVILTWVQLEQAIKAGSHPLIELLLDKGASLEDSLRVAAEFHQTVDTIHFLIDKGARDPQSQALTRAVCWDKSEIARELLARSSELASGKKSPNALPMAARMGHLNMVNLLLDHGLEIDSEDDLGQTPLLAACSANQPSCPVVQTLLRRGASVTAKTSGVAGSPYEAGDTPCKSHERQFALHADRREQYTQPLGVAIQTSCESSFAPAQT